MQMSNMSGLDVRGFGNKLFIYCFVLKVRIKRKPRFTYKSRKFIKKDQNWIESYHFTGQNK